MPTFRQDKAATKFLENDGKSVSKAMLEAGFSPNTSKNPQSLTRSKAWPILIEKKLSDKKLLKRHNQLLDKKEFIAIGKPGEREVLPTGEIDPIAVARGLDMAYKLRAKYPVEKVGGDTNVAVINVINYGEPEKESIEAKID